MADIENPNTHCYKIRLYRNFVLLSLIRICPLFFSCTLKLQKVSMMRSNVRYKVVSAISVRYKAILRNVQSVTLKLSARKVCALERSYCIVSVNFQHEIPWNPELIN